MGTIEQSGQHGKILGSTFTAGTQVMVTTGRIFISWSGAQEQKHAGWVSSLCPIITQLNSLPILCKNSGKETFPWPS